MKRSWWALLGIAICLAGCAKPAPEAEPEAGPVSVETAKVTVRTILDTLSIQGSFVPAQGASAKLAASAPGRVAQVLVKEGDSVTAGQLLAVLDDRVQKAQSASATLGATSAEDQANTARLTAQAARKDQELSVSTAQLALETAKTEAAGEIDQREIDLRTAEADLSRLKEGARPQERAQARQAVIQAEVALQKATLEYRRSQALAQEGFISKRDLADANTAVTIATSNLESQRQAESLLLAGARPQELQAAELRVRGARTAYTNAKSLGARKVALAEAALRQARQSQLTVQAREADAAASAAAAQQKGADANSARASQALLEIRAPFSGRVSRRFLNPGDSADTTVPVLEVVGSGKVDFLGAVPASNAGEIKTGMAADVAGAQGRVTSVSTGDPATGLVTVRIATVATATAGTYGTATIVTAIHPKVLAIPSDALVQREGKQVVFVVEDGAAKQVEVEPGPEDRGFVEIDKGVKEGQEVVKLGQSELSDGAKVKEAPPKADEAKPDDEKNSDEKKAGGGG